MVTDENGRGPAPGTTRVRLRWLAIVVAVMALLTAGWPLLNSAVANRQPLAKGARVTVGTGRASSGTVTVGPGWYVEPAQSNPALEYRLLNGPLLIDIRHMSLIDRQQVASLWRGMRAVMSVIDPGSSLSQRVRTVTIHGAPAVTGTISGPTLVGTVTIVPGPSREFAITMIVLAPRHADLALRTAARRVVLSLMFPGTSR